MSRRLLPGVAARADLPSGLLDRLVAIAVAGAGAGADRAAVRELVWALCDRGDLGAERARALAAANPDTAVLLARSGLLSPADVDPAARLQATLAVLEEGSGQPEWARLTAASPDREVRWRLASCPGLPTDVAEALAADPDPGVAAEFALWTADPAVAARLATHPDAEVRSAAALNECTPPGVLAALVTGEGLPPARSCPVCRRGEAPAPDESPARARCSGAHESAVHDTLERAARNPATPAAVAAGLAGHPSVLVRWALAERADLPQEAYERLGADPAPAVRRTVAGNPAIGEPLIRALAACRDDADVLRAVARHPRLPLDVLADVASAVRIGPVLLPSIAAAAPDDLARAAASAPAAVRMLIAERHDLPAPLRDALAGDADAAVAKAAARTPGCPGSSCARWWRGTGYRSARGSPRTLAPPRTCWRSWPGATPRRAGRSARSPSTRTRRSRRCWRAWRTHGPGRTPPPIPRCPRPWWPVCWGIRIRRWRGRRPAIRRSRRPRWSGWSRRPSGPGRPGGRRAEAGRSRRLPAPRAPPPPSLPQPGCR
ncbi:hypothetical protein SUDANB120_00714 [Streptomyces sp. enrichment culture]|uniref:hypothetical protein n=1 Tax=Streptomyces sp. enrichment culture TaxID=1795815 RepID=UPI003F569459